VTREVEEYYDREDEGGRLEQDVFRPRHCWPSRGWDGSRRTSTRAGGTRREQLLAWVRSVEAEPSLLGVSAHLLAVARRP
jgi:hypothetical protein